ncbi:peptidase domain-containing ABC transporter [Salibacterium salarium]|uniref:Peptidase domain-containing ABC transporter n=1 Tax=Salibacterium salarium TaxID=284579 RepID=A0A428MS59_9BACI|nr:peptidase domain-containing ABC transporter [Salibacterium salarium]RSL29003.1 peptidase domain-containing ABC transporter [Salibacterium salarium]
MSSKISGCHTRQLDGNDCGVACVSSVLKYHGLYYGIDYLRDLLNKKNEYTIKDLISIFTSFPCFTTKAIQIEENKSEETFKNIEMPCIALINKNNEGHYIVIYAVEKDKLIISDPLQEQTNKLSLDNFEKSFSGIALIINKNETSLNKVSYSGESDKFKKLSFFKDLTKGNKLFFFFIFLFSLVVVILTAAASLFLKLIVDLIIPNNLNETLSFLAIVFLSIALVRVFFDYFRNIFIIKLAYKLDERMADNYFDKIINLPINFFHNRDDGEIISRFNDSIHVRNIFSTNIVTAILDLTIILGVGFTLYLINNILFLTVLLPILFLVTIAVLFYKILNRRNERLMISQSVSTSYLVQFLKNMTSIYSFNKKDYFRHSFKKVYSKQLKATLNEEKMVNLNQMLNQLVKGLFFVIILWVGAQQVINDSITIGTLLVINTLTMFLLNSLERIIGAQSEIQKGLVATDRFNSILNYPVYFKGNQPIDKKIQKIDIENFSYSFDFFDRIFENVNLKIEQNDHVLLMGKSGVGKSTFAKTLVRLYEIPPSSIFINNQDALEFNVKSLREKILYLSESPFLFKDTIRENLCMGEQFTVEEIRSACDISEISDTIFSSELGLDFVLNENASNLSTGQKQRLYLAKSILKKPDVIVMDESLSNVDNELFEKIHWNLKSLDCIIISIYHNAGDIKKFNRILELNDKNIIEHESYAYSTGS